MARRDLWARLRAARAPVAVMVALLCAGALLPRAALAEAPDLGQALEIWLADDEATALPALARLAHDGDDRARLFLGLIEKTPALQGPWLARLDRAERLAVMRAPGGLSGQSWLGQVGPDPVAGPLATLWREVLQVGTGLDTVQALTELGEIRAARRAVLTIAMREELAPGSAWPAWLDTELAWAVWPFARAALRDDIARVVPPDHPQWALMGRTLPEGSLSAWLRDSAAARPLQALCAALCPDSVADCRLAAYTALGSHAAVLTLGSPAEALIPESAFLTSARGRQAAFRRMLMATDMRGRAALLARTHAADACLGAHLAAASESYRYSRNSLPRAP